MNLESDIDNVLNADDVDAAAKKFMATKNCKKEQALRLAYQRSTTEKDRKKIEEAFNALVKSGENLI